MWKFIKNHIGQNVSKNIRIFMEIGKRVHFSLPKGKNLDLLPNYFLSFIWLDSNSSPDPDLFFWEKETSFYHPLYKTLDQWLSAFLDARHPSLHH